MVMTCCSLAKPGQVTGAMSADNLAEQDADYCEHASNVTHYLASMQSGGCQSGLGISDTFSDCRESELDKFNIKLYVIQNTGSGNKFDA